MPCSELLFLSDDLHRQVDVASGGPSLRGVPGVGLEDCQKDELPILSEAEAIREIQAVMVMVQYFQKRSPFAPLEKEGLRACCS